MTLTRLQPTPTDLAAFDAWKREQERKKPYVPLPYVVGVEIPPRVRSQRVIDALRPYEGMPEVKSEIGYLVDRAMEERARVE